MSKYGYVADFETNTSEKNCRVWAYAISDIDNPENVEIGNSIDDFMKWCMHPKHTKAYFHNLKFDGQFIISWLLKNGYTCMKTDDYLQTKTFTCIISDLGMFYEIDIMFERKKKSNRIKIIDSLKLIPLPVSKIAKSFKMPISKLEIDYNIERLEGHELTEQEKDYVTNDVKIVAYALKYFFDSGLNKLTIGSCALNEYKTIINKKFFKAFYPSPTYDRYIRPSYRGGFTYLNPKFANKVVKEGIVLDVNSLYPSVMYNDLLPYGEGIYFEGKYKYNPIYNLYIQSIRCQFELKPGHIPTIQIKYGGIFAQNEYLTSSNEQEVELCLTSVDLKLFFDHYNVYNIEYKGGWAFKGAHNLFKEYIEKWSQAKINAKKEGNHGLYLISKLFLNSLYGKFASSTSQREKYPYLKEDGTIGYMMSEPKEKEGVYLPVATFITAYARNKTIRSAQKITDAYNRGESDIEFIYADTDSLHLKSKGHKVPTNLDIDPYLLGAWKYESKFIKAKFIRQKCYIELSTEDIENEEPEYELKVTVAGMPPSLHKQVTFSNFKAGAIYSGKLLPKNVEGGVILAPVDFTIKK